MKTTVIIKKRGAGYICTVHDPHRSYQGARCGLTPFDAAASAAEVILKYAANNPEGGTLMAPGEVKSLVPKHLHEIAGNGQPS